MKTAIGWLVILLLALSLPIACSDATDGTAIDGRGDADAGTPDANADDGASDTEGAGPAFEDLAFTLEHRGPGTEVNYIVEYDGALFATISVWNIETMGPPITVLRKDAPWDDWVVDFELPQHEAEYHSRSESMARLTFTTDHAGNPLAQPVTLLVLGAGQQSADKHSHPWANTVWTRVSSGSWVRTIVSTDVTRLCDNDDKPTTRSLEVYRDAVTGTDHIFVGTGDSRIYRGGYDPAAPGLLRFDPAPIFQGSGRVMSLRGTPYGLFASVSQKDLAGDCPAVSGLPEGLMRYRDGTAAVDLAHDPYGAFEQVDQWESDDRAAEDSCRGLTLLPHPTQSGEEALFCGLEDPGHIVYWGDLGETPQRTLEFDMVEGIEALGDPAYPGYRIGPYNELTEARDPHTGETVHLIGLYFRSMQIDLDGHLLIRRLDGGYQHVVIPSPDGKALRGVRTIVPSPWPEEPATFYLGGFDAHDGPHVATGWIQRWGPTAAPADGGQ